MALQLKKKSANNTEAKWFDYGDDTKIQLVGIDDKNYQVALERARRRLRNNDARFEEGKVGVVEGEKTEHESQCALLAAFILKDWEGAQDEDGNPLKYTPELGAQMLDSDIEFFIFVLKSATAFAGQMKEELDETMGKPSPASSGKGSGRAKQKSEAPSTPD